MISLFTQQCVSLFNFNVTRLSVTLRTTLLQPPTGYRGTSHWGGGITWNKSESLTFSHWLSYDKKVPTVHAARAYMYFTLGELCVCLPFGRVAVGRWGTICRIYMYVYIIPRLCTAALNQLNENNGHTSA